MKKIFLALVLASVSATAAADSFVYGGFQVGKGSYKGDDATSYGIHVGTGIIPFVGLEVGYWDFGDYDYGADQKADITSFNFSLKPSIDFGPVHAYGKVGIHKWQADGSSVSDNDFDIIYGAGLEYKVLDVFSIGLGYNNFVVGDENIDFVSLNTTFHFL